MATKIVLLDAKTLGTKLDLSALREYGDLQLYEYTDPHQVLRRVVDANVIITNKVAIDRNTISRAHNLDLIFVTASTIDTVDVAAAKEHDVIVKDAGAYATHSVVQMTFAMMLALLTRLYDYARYVRSLHYSDGNVFSYIGEGFVELNNKTLGIVGLGRIGRTVASVAECFGATAVYYSTTGANDNPDYRRVSLDQLLTNSDVVSIHAPLTDKTRNLFSLQELNRMKSTAILINTARGGIVNEHDLATALDAGMIFAAALDVFQSEPLDVDNPLLALGEPNRLLLTPHCSWGSIEARRRLIEEITRALQDLESQSVNSPD